MVKEMFIQALVITLVFVIAFSIISGSLSHIGETVKAPAESFDSAVTMSSESVTGRTSTVNLQAENANRDSF